jgi:hypothetical protein
MRKVWRAASPVAVVVVAAMLAGCVPQPQHPTPSVKPSVAPVFASDAAALAAAKKAYEGYLAASDAIAQAGGVDTSSLSQWDTAKQLVRDKASFGRLAARKEHISGRSTYSHFTLQDLDQSPLGRVQLVAYACMDVSETRLLDGSGNDVTPDRIEIVPLQLTFTNATKGSKTFLIDGSDSWSGNDFCS